MKLSVDGLVKEWKEMGWTQRVSGMGGGGVQTVTISCCCLVTLDGSGVDNDDFGRSAWMRGSM